MSQNSIRFIHAAQLRLDSAWQGVGAIPSQLAPLVEEATTIAWEQLQRQCRELQVDFLLLTGNTLVAADHPLSGEAALIRGLNQLADFEIPVYLIPGELDPEHYWDSIDHRLPDNSFRLSAHDPAGLVCRRSSEPIATILPLAGPSGSNPENWIDNAYWETWGDQLVDRDSPFPIALVHQYPLDTLPDYSLGDSGTFPSRLESQLRDSRIRYFASGATLRRWTSQIAGRTWHVPGSLVGFQSSLSKSVGCSVVDVDPQGKIQIRQLAVSPVRRERISVRVVPITQRADLIENIIGQLSNSSSGRVEQLCWSDLSIQGAGGVIDELQGPEALDELRREIYELTNSEQVPLWIDRIEFQDNRPNSELIAGSSRLSIEYLQQMDHWRELQATEKSTILNSVSAPNGFTEQGWEQVRSEMDLDEILMATRAWGVNLLSNHREVLDEDH